MYTVGCDQHKRYSFVISKDQDGNTVDQLKLYHADKDEMKDYFRALPEGSRVALEASGFSFWLADMLQELNIDVKLVHAAKAKAIAEERIKTDKMSAGVLADLLRVNMLPQAYIAPRPVRQARAILRYRQSLIGLRTSLKNRIHAVINQQGIQQSFSDLFTKTGRQFIDQLELGEPYQSVAQNYLSIIDGLNLRINAVEAQLRQQLKSDKLARLLTTIPGVGVIISHLILAEIGDISRFSNQHRLARYIGIVPSLHQSGQVCYHGRIAKGGNKYLRTAFVEAAQVAVRRDAYLRLFFNKIKAKKGYNKAIIAVAHKLIRSAYAVLKFNKPYYYRAIKNG